MPIQLVYETHSITVDNEAGIATGWLPGELSEAGRQNGAELGARRRNDSVDVIYTSDLERARDTARIALGDSGIPMYPDRRLRECNYGELNGAPVKALIPRRAHIDQPFPGGQSYRQVADQTALFLAELLVRYDDARVALIAHSANRWALEHLLLDIPLEELVDAPFPWQQGWEFVVPTGWSGQGSHDGGVRG